MTEIAQLLSDATQAFITAARAAKVAATVTHLAVV